METSTGCVDSVSKRNVLRNQQGRFQIIPFRSRHVREIKPDATDAFIRLSEYAQDNGFAWTACLCGTPIGAAGMCIKEADTAELWCLFTPLFKSMPIALYRSVKEKFAEARSRLDRPLRIFCHVDPNDEAAVRFATRLGLKQTLHVYEIEG